MKHYYRVRDDAGELHNDVERGLAKIEDEAAQAIRRMEAGFSGTDDDDRITIAGFLVLQHLRGPYGQGILAAMAEEVGLKMMLTQLENDSADNLAEILGEPGEPLSVEAAEQARQRLLRDFRGGRLRIKATREHSIAAMLQQVPEVAPVVASLGWSLLEGASRHVLRGLRHAAHDAQP